MRRIIKMKLLLLCACICTFCSNKENQEAIPSTENIPAKPAVEGIRIAWDYSTLKKVSAAGTGARYNGYARMVQLQDKTLLCVYEADGSVVAVKSTDAGASWSAPVTVAARQNGFNMTVPDILELSDGSLLVCYNPRPYEVDPSRRFAIRTKKSYDGGATWQEDRLLYEAGYQFENGCWEPSAIQLPDGEIQLFFANEGPYTYSDEQNISLLRSKDNGLTWTNNPEIVSFRAGNRDGMPVPLLLQNGNEIVFSIEDNGSGNFKPYTIRSSIADNWSAPVDANSPNRNYALADKINDYVYAGAPYLRQLPTGETILSYQGTEGRANKLESAEMKVVIGNSEAQNFNRKTSPFSIPEGKSGLWNSLAVLDDYTIVALTSTNAYSATGNTEVWMIKGHVVPESAAAQTTLTVDGAQEEPIWREHFPVFIGQKSLTQVASQAAYDDQFLYIISKIRDAKVMSDSQNPGDNDGITIQLDATNKSYEVPGSGVFSFFLSADNKLVAKEGNNSQWVALKNAEGIKHASKASGAGYVQEIAIPWDLLGGKPASNTRVGFNVILTENTGKGAPDYIENISSDNENQPYTWMTLTLK